MRRPVTPCLGKTTPVPCLWNDVRRARTGRSQLGAGSTSRRLWGLGPPQSQGCRSYAALSCTEAGEIVAILGSIISPWLVLNPTKRLVPPTVEQPLCTVLVCTASRPSELRTSDLTLSCFPALEARRTSSLPATCNCSGHLSTFLCAVMPAPLASFQ